MKLNYSYFGIIKVLYNAEKKILEGGNFEVNYGRRGA